MQHTYLYPLPERARFLWRVGRAEVTDLFGDFDPSHQGGLFMHLRLSDELAHARAVIHRLIENSPRVCLGRGYTIPFSEVEDAGYHAVLHPSTRCLTLMLWHAPKLEAEVPSLIRTELFEAGDVPGRDSAEDIDAFLTAHMGQHIIPVWM